MNVPSQRLVKVFTPFGAFPVVLHCKLELKWIFGRLCTI